MKPNRPTDEGRELGAEMARLCEMEIAGGVDNRCTTCAFRAGTVPNGCPSTLMDALKCVADGEEFFCHERDELCAGWQACAASMGGKATPVPWEYTEPPSEEAVAAYRQDQAGARLTGVLFAEPLTP